MKDLLIILFLYIGLFCSNFLFPLHDDFEKQRGLVNWLYCLFSTFFWPVFIFIFSVGYVCEKIMMKKFENYKENY